MGCDDAMSNAVHAELDEATRLAKRKLGKSAAVWCIDGTWVAWAARRDWIRVTAATFETLVRFLELLPDKKDDE